MTEVFSVERFTQTSTNDTKLYIGERGRYAYDRRFCTKLALDQA